MTTRPAWWPSWPWSSRTEALLALAPLPGALAWAQADAGGRLQRCGLVQPGADAIEFARQLRSLARPGQKVRAVLPLDEGQLLQVETPAVQPEEMKAAARWKIRELVSGPLDELTLDVMFVGPPPTRATPARQIFVAAARNAPIRELSERCRGAGLALETIELAETAQRNLQHAMAGAEGLAERATAALVRHGHTALLTITAGGELYYARRLEWDGAMLAAAAAAPVSPEPELTLDSVDFIDYGAEPEAGSAGAGEAPRLVVELQRSFDVWERSWPDLPLAALWVQVGEESAALAAALQEALGQRVQPLALDRLFPALAAAAPDAATREALLPLLGTLLRDDRLQP